MKFYIFRKSPPGKGREGKGKERKGMSILYLYLNERQIGKLFLPLRMRAMLGVMRGLKLTAFCLWKEYVALSQGMVGQLKGVAAKEAVL